MLTLIGLIYLAVAIFVLAVFFLIDALLLSPIWIPLLLILILVAIAAVIIILVFKKKNNK